MKKKNELLRIIFLKLFIEEIIYNIAKKTYKPSPSKPIYSQPIPQTFIPQKNLAAQQPPLKTFQKRKPIFHRKGLTNQIQNNPNAFKTNSTNQISSPLVKSKFKEISYSGQLAGSMINPNQENLQTMLNSPNILNQSAPSTIPAIEKIMPMLRDKTVITIECPGPNKNILVKKYNQVNMTRISLTENEIRSVIDHFAKEAKIPPIGGILKAAVGNNIISAIESEFVGSRFVINKITPYSLIG